MISLPLALKDNEEIRGNRFKPIVPLFKRPVFIVDDDPEFAEQLKLRLRQFDFEVVIFHSAKVMQQALATIEPGIILMDMMLTEEHKTGAEIIQQLRHQQLLCSSRRG